MALDVTEGIVAVLYVSVMGLARCYKTTVFLWSPYVIGQTIIFFPVISIFFYLLFFPRLI